jgi:hypothetical protein
MKKTYLSPQVDVIELKNQQMLLAGSNLPMGSGDVDPSSADAPGYGGDITW